MSVPNISAVQQPVTKADKFNYADLIARLLVFIVFSGSLGLIWWSYYRVFSPHLKQFRDLTATAAKVNTDLDGLNHRWSPAQIAAIEGKISMVQTNFFADPAELKTWLADLRDQSQSERLDIKSDFAPSLVQTDAEPKFLVIPTTLTVQFQPLAGPAKGPSPYQRLLALSERIATHEKTDCLDELTVETGPNSIDHAVMNFNFWAATNVTK